MSARYESEHKRVLDTMKGDRQKELEKLKSEAAASALSQQALTNKLDKVTARKSILEQEVCRELGSLFAQMLVMLLCLVEG